MKEGGHISFRGTSLGQKSNQMGGGWDPPGEYSGRKISPAPPVRLWDQNMTEIKSMNLEDRAPQAIISHLETDHNNSAIVALVGLCF